MIEKTIRRKDSILYESLAETTTRLRDCIHPRLRARLVYRWLTTVALWFTQMEIRNHPCNWVHRMKGQLLRTLGRPEEALSAYREAVTHWPDDIFSLHELAEIYDELGEAEESLQFDARGYYVDPNLHWHADEWRIAKKFVALSRYGEAIPFVEKAIQSCQELMKPKEFSEKEKKHAEKFGITLPVWDEVDEMLANEVWSKDLSKLLTLLQECQQRKSEQDGG